ncbi:DNA repair protein rad18 [Hypomontagnella monticulosa]|nr:DNA repair protein rad18 [Hypomontagnella monticulosa]
MKGNAILDDVADSTDWLPTPLSGLAAVEATLRCQVCKDFYKTPMLTSCNHTFCSICIRRALSNDGKCPLCRASEQELKLRTNWPMEEVVTAFTKARADVLLFAKSQDGPTKRKRGEAESLDPANQPEGKRLRSSTRLSKSRSMETTSEMARLEVDIPDQDPTDFEPDDGLVACPICLQRMKEAQVDKHLDTSCPGEFRPQQPTSSRSTSIPTTFSSSSPRKELANPPSRLPSIHYAVLKDGPLRKKLSELGISTAGSRQMLERRHKEWITIWNANCDSQYPRRKAELLHDLDVWERTVGARAPTTSRALSLGAQIKDKDFDGAAWAAKHDVSFKDLIASARRNRKPAEKESGEGVDREPKTSMVENQGNGEGEPKPQPDEEMIASLEHSEEPEKLRRPICPLAEATGTIDLTGDITSNASDAALSDGHSEGRRVDLGTSPGTTVMS